MKRKFQAEERRMRLMGVIGFFVVVLVVAPTLQVGAALAAATPSVATTGAPPMVLGTPGTGGRSAKTGVTFGGGTGHFAVNGHTANAGKFTPSFVKRLRKSAGALPRSSLAGRVVQVGVIRLVGTRTLELARPARRSLNAGSRILYSMAAENFLSHVSVPRLAWLQLRNPQGHLTLQRATSLEQLHVGVKVLVAGDAVAGALRARVISTVSGARVHRISPVSANLQDKAVERQTVTSNGTTADFGGTSQLGNYSWVHDFNNTLIFTIGIVEIRLRKVSFTAGLGGAFYRWPFEFSATPRSPFVMGQPTTVDVQVTPRSRSDGGYTLNFTSGIDAGVQLYVWLAVGCGTLGLYSCKYFPEPHVGLGISLSTRSPAPMPGQSIKLDANTCPSVPIFAIPVVNWGLVLKGCLAITVKGNSFDASLSTSGARLDGRSVFSFDGKTPYSVTLTPTAPQFNLTFGIFGYYTTWDVGFEPILALNPFGVKFSIGSLTFVSNQRKDWIGSPTNQTIQLIFPLNQPSTMVFPFSVGSQSSGGSSSPGPGKAVDACQQGGSTGLIATSGTTDALVSNAAQCVSYDAHGGTTASFTVQFTSKNAGQGEVYFGSGPGCFGLVQVATQDKGAGTTNHTVVVTGNDLPGTVGNIGIQPGATYSYEVVTVSPAGTEIDNGNGACYTVSIPRS